MTVRDLLNVLDVHNARTISIIWNDKIVWAGCIELKENS